MGRIEKLKREAIQEANKRNLGIIDENHAGFSLGFANNGGLTITEDNEAEEDYKRYLNQVAGDLGIEGKGNDHGYKSASGEILNIYTFDYAEAQKLADKGIIAQNIFNELTKLYKASQEISETTLSQAFNYDNEGDKEEVDMDQIEEQDDVPLDEIT